MRFSKSDYIQKRREIVGKYGPGIKSQVLPVLPHYEAIRVLEARGAELQKEREKRDINRNEIALHVCGYWGLKSSFARNNIIQRMESSDYFTHFLVPRINGRGQGRVFFGIPVVYLHTSLRTADYAALLGYDEDRQKALFEDLKKGIPNLLFAPSPLQPYQKGVSRPLEHVSFEEQLRQRGLV